MTNLECNREEMQDTIVKALGLEHRGTIWFYDLCEQYDDNPQNNAKLFEIMSAMLNIIQYASELE